MKSIEININNELVRIVENERIVNKLENLRAILINEEKNPCKVLNLKNDNDYKKYNLERGGLISTVLCLYSDKSV